MATTTIPHRTFIIFKKADWKGFTEEIGRRFGKTTPFKTMHEAGKTLKKSTTKAAGRHMPQDCIKTIIPIFPNETAELAKQRDQLQQYQPGDSRILEMTRNINRIVHDNKKQERIDFLTIVDHKCGSATHWSTVKALTQADPKIRPTPHIENLPFVKRRKIANLFNQQFTPHPTKPDTSFSKEARTCRKLRIDYIAVSKETIREAIKSTKKL